MRAKKLECADGTARGVFKQTDNARARTYQTCAIVIDFLAPRPIPRAAGATGRDRVRSSTTRCWQTSSWSPQTLRRRVSPWATAAAVRKPDRATATDARSTGPAGAVTLATANRTPRATRDPATPWCAGRGRRAARSKKKTHQRCAREHSGDTTGSGRAGCAAPWCSEKNNPPTVTRAPTARAYVSQSRLRR